MASKLFESIQQLPNDTNYFQMQLISPCELSGEYIIVRNIQESFFNFETHTLEDKVVSRVAIIYFDLKDSQLEILGNRSGANKLTTLFSELLGGYPINALEISLHNIIERMRPMKIKVGRVSFKDFLFAEDIVGSFNVDLSSYGDAFSVLKKYKEKITRMTVMLPISSGGLKVSLTASGIVTAYKQRDMLEDDAIGILHDLLTN